MKNNPFIKPLYSVLKVLFIFLSALIIVCIILFGILYFGGRKHIKKEVKLHDNSLLEFHFNSRGFLSPKYSIHIFLTKESTVKVDTLLVTTVPEIIYRISNKTVTILTMDKGNLINLSNLSIPVIIEEVDVDEYEKKLKTSKDFQKFPPLN